MYVQKFCASAPKAISPADCASLPGAIHSCSALAWYVENILCPPRSLPLEATGFA